VTPSMTCGSCIPLYLSYHIISFISDLISSTLAMNIPLDYVRATCYIEFRLRGDNEPSIIVDLDNKILVNNDLEN